MLLLFFSYTNSAKLRGVFFVFWLSKMKYKYILVLVLTSRSNIIKIGVKTYDCYGFKIG